MECQCAFNEKIVILKAQVTEDSANPRLEVRLLQCPLQSRALGVKYCLASSMELVSRLPPFISRAVLTVCLSCQRTEAAPPGLLTCRLQGSHSWFWASCITCFERRGSQRLQQNLSMIKAMKCVLSILGGKNLIILVERASACGDILYCFKESKEEWRGG